MKKLVIYYFFLLLSIFSILSSGVIDSQDGFQYLAVARNIYYKGEPTAPVYEYDTRKNVHLSTIVGKDGKTYSLTGLGFSLAMLPGVAITDIVYKIYGVSPPTHFPLENDWLIFLTASFTNAFFGAILGVILLLYLIDLGLSKKSALFISFVGLFTTNLLAYSKHSFPHMMFTSFLFLSFFLIKIHFQTKKKLFLILAGVTFGITSITYNQTFLLTVIPLIIYFLLLSKIKLNISFISNLFIRLLLFFLGFLPFLVMYFWFENLRAAPPVDLGSSPATPTGVSGLLRVPIGVFIEGLYGQLLSPGRSFFIYSPIILLIIFFWHKIKKNLAEFWVFFILSILYIVFYSSIYNPGNPLSIPIKGVAALWHGENSFGPRYLVPLIPFGLLIVGVIYKNFSKITKLLIFLPLLILGGYVQFLGTLMPYQIKLHDLEERFFVNSTEYTNFLYSNLLPRYSPIFMMSKKMVKLFQTFPQTLDHGIYNVRFYDGIDFPFPVGGERWRVVDKIGSISFDNPINDHVKKISLGLINHPLEEASYSARVDISLNQKKLVEKISFLPTERKLVNLDVPENLLQAKENILNINVKFVSLTDDAIVETGQYKDDPSLYENKNVVPKKYISQILGLISIFINNKAINKETLDFPYVSALGPTMMGIKYNIYGEEIIDPWRFWDIHSQTYERLPDFWWIRNLYYWDIPKTPLILLFLSMVLQSIIFGYKTYKSITN